MLHALYNFNMNTPAPLHSTAWPHMPEADYWLLEGAKAGNIDVIDQAMSEGARIDCLTRFDLHSPVEISAKEGHRDAMARLLDLEAASSTLKKIDSRAGALILAALKGRSACVAELLARGAPTASDMESEHIKLFHKDRNALMWAIEGGYEECAMLLISKTSPQAAAPDGTQAIHLAARQKLQNVIKAIALSGANLDARDGKGRTALHHACLSRSEMCCQELIMHGARGDLNDGEGIPAWGYALFKAWKAGFELLSPLDDLQRPARLTNANTLIHILDTEPRKLDFQIHSGIASPHFPEVMNRVKLWFESVQCKAAIAGELPEPRAPAKKARL